MTDVDWMPAGTKVSAERILMRNPAQIWSRVRTGVDPGGFTGAVKAMLFVEYVIFGGGQANGMEATFKVGILDSSER